MAAMRIWIARSEPGATRTGERVRALGHDPLVAPVLAIVPTSAPWPAGAFAGLLLTSANALGADAPGEDALAEPSRLRAHRAVPVFAVGRRTAALARAAGFESVSVAEGDAAGLARLVRATLPPGAALLHLAGENRKAEPGASLAAAGYRVTTVVAYAARPLAALPDAVADALAGGVPVQAVLHYSRRSATLARDLAGEAGRGGAFAALRHYCLSADVAAPLAEAGIAAHFVARVPTEDDLLAGLASGL